MNSICLDTSAYSHFKRGDEEAIRTIRSARVVNVPVIVLGELRSGFRLGGHQARNEEELRHFLSYPVIQVRTATIITDDGVEISRNFHRHVLLPDADLSNEGSDVVALANTVFTAEAKAAYADYMAAQENNDG